MSGGVILNDPRRRGEIRTMGRPCHGDCTAGSRLKSPRRGASGAGSFALFNELSGHESEYNVD